MRVVRRDAVAASRMYASVIASCTALIGLILLATDNEFTTPTTRIAYDTAPPRAWAIMFLVVAGWFFVSRRRRLSAVPLAFALTAWSSMTGWAALTVSGASHTAWVWSACLASLLLLGIARNDL